MIKIIVLVFSVLCGSAFADETRLEKLDTQISKLQVLGRINANHFQDQFNAGRIDQAFLEREVKPRGSASSYLLIVASLEKIDCANRDVSSCALAERHIQEAAEYLAALEKLAAEMDSGVGI